MKLSKKKVHDLKNERKVIDIKKEKTAAEAVVGRDTSTRRAENRAARRPLRASWNHACKRVLAKQVILKAERRGGVERSNKLLVKFMFQRNRKESGSDLF